MLKTSENGNWNRMEIKTGIVIRLWSMRFYGLLGNKVNSVFCVPTTLFCSDDGLKVPSICIFIIFKIYSMNMCRVSELFAQWGYK